MVLDLVLDRVLDLVLDLVQVYTRIGYDVVL